MRLLDVNVVIARQRDDHPHHELVRPLLDRLTRTSEPFTVPAVVVAGATRVLTSHRIFSDPTPLAEVFAFVQALVEQPNHVALGPGPGHLEIFEGLCRTYDAAGDLAGDAHLAAIALEHDCTLVSTDRDFARFAELRWETPDRDL